ncbi:HTH domain-containing protein [Bradyrhizobium sp. AZCC 2289]|uniref:HTH domain-containing protein n=1 Tax=Bradyrhizobium sp. AZCC 2289 TaxID=3117026 RepID=UPI002FEE68F5
MIDVVFMHGLDGDAYRTWGFNSEPSWSTWIAEKFPNTRIWSLEYRIRSSWWFGGAMPLYDRAVNVLATVSSELISNTKIIVICHSYGGLVAKEMVRAALDTAPEYRLFADRIAGFVFLGTPQNGSAIAQYVAALDIVYRGSRALSELRQNQPTARQLGQWFRQSAGKFGWRLRVFFETLKTSGIWVVDESSSDPAIAGVTAIGIDANHIDLSKPTEPDVRVKRTLSLIQEVLDALSPPGGWQIIGSIQQPSVSVSFNFHSPNVRLQAHQSKRETFDPAKDRTEAKLGPDEAFTRHQASPENAALPQAAVADALERDFTSRYERALQRSIFPELHNMDEFVPLAIEVLDPAGASLSPDLRRAILFRATRSAAIRGHLQEAQRFLAVGQGLSGSVSDAPARGRIAVAEGRTDDAIQILRDAPSDDARSVLLSILAVERSDDEALGWFSENGLSPARLTAFGVLTLCQLYLRRSDLEAVSRVLLQATSDQLAQAPYLYFLRGAMRFARLLPVPEQATALSGLPMDVRNARPIVGDSELSAALNDAINDLRQALPLASTLGLRRAPRIIESYIIWCELLHPTRKQAALAQLRRDMEDNALAVLLVQYALAYLRDYKPASLEAYLQRRESFGGLSDEELRAALAIRLHKDDAAGLASFIATKRQQAEASFGKNGILSLEIQALAKSGDATSAKIIFENNLSLFDAGQVAGLRTEIAKAEGADPVAEHLRLYESEKTADALRALVNALVRKQDHIGIAKYAELLFAETKDRQDIALAAQASIRAGDGDNLVRLIAAHPALKDYDVNFLRNYGWQLFRLGRLREAKEIAEQVERKYPACRDLQFESAIALETGEWETLAAPLAAALEPARNLDGLSLIRAAHLAQASGQGPLMDLIAAALAKGENDPNVLLGAYSLFVEEGLEEERPEAHEWFRKALALSGPDGPVQTFEMKELLSQQTEWNEHTRNVTENMTRGDLPLAVAGPGLRTTIVDIILRNLIRNSKLVDGRRRAAIPLFTGRRLPAPVGTPASLALDITAFLVLGWLGLLPKVFDAFPKIVVPAGVLTELFEGRRRIRQAQRTRLRKAIEIRDAIAKGQLKVLRTPSLGRDPLSTEVGIELSALLREAKTANGLVVRSAPVNRIGLDERGEADMTGYSERLCDMHGLLKALVDLNAIDEETEKSAKRYFDVQDRGWPASAVPEPGRPVLVDGLSLTYLQHTGLLQSLLRTFRTVYIHVSTEEEANVLIEHDQNVSEVLRVIDDIRIAVRRANAAGHVIFGPRRADTGENDPDGMQSTLNLLTNLKGVEAVVFDDRALNKEPFAADETGHRARMLSTLDILEELLTRGALVQDQYRALRYRLRIGGAMLVPADASELSAAAKRNRQNEAPEFRAIRDGFDLARLSEMPQFPSEMRWFMSYVQAVKGAIMQIWNDEPDEERARAMASAIFDIRPMPDDWCGRWNGNPPPNWIAAVRRALVAGFALPVEISDRAKLRAYQKWIDDIMMSELRSLSPETYQQVVEYLRNFALMSWDEDDED